MRVVISIQQMVPQWQIPAEAVDALRSRFPDLHFDYATTADARAEGLAHCDVAYTWLLSARELASAPRLRWVHTSAVAVETLCLPELAARGVRVSNTRGVQAVPIAEHVLAVTLALAKQLPFTLENQRAAHWAQAEYVGARQPWLLRGRTLGLIGLGTIGRAIAERARALGMRVVATRRHEHAAAEPHVDRLLPPSALGELLKDSDVLVIAAPLTPDTNGLIGTAEIAAMKPGALVVNIGRAKILDTDALVDALMRGHLGGASLDVFPVEPLPPGHPLWRCPNVVLTPHTAGFRQGHWDEVIDVFADNLERFRRGEPLRFEVRPDEGY
jgi:phosphoglycerate dehydrogenase-like enzyme